MATGIGISPLLGRGGGGVVPSTIGTIIHNDWTEANWTEVGSPASVTYESDGITFVSDGAGAVFSQGIYYNQYYSQLENWELSADIKLLSDTSVYGPSVSILNAAVPPYYSTVFLTGLGGRMDLWSLSNYVNNAGTTTFSINDVLRMNLKKVNGTIIIDVQNITQASSVFTYTLTLDFNYPFASNLLPNIFNVGFSALGAGNFKIVDYTYSSTDLKNIDCCFISDSKGFYFSGAYSNILKNNCLASNPTKTMTASGAANETLLACINKLPELLSVNASKYFIYLGCNDYRNSSATIAANMTTIRNALGDSRCYYVQSTIESDSGSGIGSIGTNALNVIAAGVFTNIIDTSSIVIGDIEADGIHLKSTTFPLLAALIDPYI